MHSLLIVAAPLANTIKQFTSNAQVSDEVEVVHCLKVVDQRYYRSVTLRISSKLEESISDVHMETTSASHQTHLRYLFQSCNFISHHMFSPLHQSFTDDFASIILTSLDVYCLFDDSVGSLSQRLANFVPVAQPSEVSSALSCSSRYAAIKTHAHGTVDPDDMLVETE
jgi:hypothetical protein